MTKTAQSTYITYYIYYSDGLPLVYRILLTATKLLDITMTFVITCIKRMVIFWPPPFIWSIQVTDCNIGNLYLACRWKMKWNLESAQNLATSSSSCPYPILLGVSQHVFFFRSSPSKVFFFFGGAGLIMSITNSVHGGNVSGRQCQTSTN